MMVQTVRNETRYFTAIPRLFVASDGNTSQIYGASPAIWDHSLAPDTGERAPP